jgi:sugar phosphate isomerase/epimerase
VSPSRYIASSNAFPGQGIKGLEEIGIRENLPIEFSSGVQYEEDLERKFMEAKCEKYIHNYFPIPKESFVLNLASLNDDIWRRSVDHGIRAITLAGKSQVPFYSIHAGFCLDPNPNELGEKITGPKESMPRAHHWEAFLKAINILLIEAEKRNVDLLVENNVIIEKNLVNNRQSPLLVSDPQEAEKILATIKSKRFGFLLDTAHLKVSAQTMKYDPEAFIGIIQKRTKGIHHSDNNGWVDNNQPLEDDYWFLAHMSKFKDLYHVIEVNNISPADMKTQMALLKNASNKNQEDKTLA